MAFNPLENKNTEQEKDNNVHLHRASSIKNNSDKNDYGLGLAEDQEVKFLYFKDRKNYKPAVPFNNEPPESVFEQEFDEKTNNDDNDIPNFDEPPPDAYLNDAPSINSIDASDFWDDPSNESVPANEPAAIDELPTFNEEHTPIQDVTAISNVPVRETQTNNSLNNANSNNSNDKKPKYDYDKLESLPLDFLLLHVGAYPIKGQKNRYEYYQQDTAIEIVIDGQRWYNETLKRGFEGAISLCKELMAIHQRIDPFKNSRILGGKACKYIEGALSDYYKEYKKEPPVFTKNTNYTKKDSNVVRPTKDNPFSYIEIAYSALTKEEKVLYFNVLDSLKFSHVAKVLNQSKDFNKGDNKISIVIDKDNENQFILSNLTTTEKLFINVDDRSWRVRFGKKEKFGVGTLSFTALALAFSDQQNFFEKDIAKKYRMDSSRFLGNNIQAEDIDLKAFELETMEVDKEDINYIYKLPYHRLNEEEKTNYFTGIENFPLEELASLLGGSDYEDGTAHKWKFRETFMTENIHIDNEENQWKSWNSDGGGKGAISLMTYYLMCKDGEDYSIKDLRKSYRFEAAKQILSYMDGGAVSFEKRNKLHAEVFTMPYILEAKNPHVKDYLCEKRQLPKWVVQKQMNAGFLFAGYPAHWKEIPKLKTPEFMSNDVVWATFLTVSGQAAEMRGIARSDHNAKILAKGSEKDLGGFLTKAEPKYNEFMVCSFEAAIDSLSYHAIYPGRITQSCMGTEYKLAAKAAAEILAVTAVKTKHSCCFDNDFAGIKATIRYFHHLKTLMRDEDAYEQMIEKQKTNPDYMVADEILYKDFIQAYKSGRINMFELTVKDLEESLKQGKTFYLDVLEDKLGMEAAKMFYQIASNTLGKDIVKKAYDSGQFKYMNILPTPKVLEKELVEITSQTLDKLLSNHNYYLEMPDIESYLVSKDEDFNNLTDDEKSVYMSKAKQVLTNFHHEFEKQAGDKLKDLVEKGSVVYSRQTLFKDWNEHLIYMKNNNPEFADMLKAREIEFEHYSAPDAPKVKPGKIRG